jgi:hypothetical protein
MVNDGARCQPAFLSQIITELREYLVLRGTRRRWRRWYHAHLTQHRQQPLHRRPVAGLDGPLPRSVLRVPFGHVLIEISELQSAYSSSSVTTTAPPIAALPSTAEGQAGWVAHRRGKPCELYCAVLHRRGPPSPPARPWDREGEAPQAPAADHRTRSPLPTPPPKATSLALCRVDWGVLSDC